jgi:CO dehydrogenase maturation factor
VVEPGQRSVATAHRVQEMARELGIRRFGVVLNKSVTPTEDREWIAGEFAPGALLGTIPLDRRIADADRAGVALVDLGVTDLLAPFKSLQHALNSMSKEKSQ